eukprot:TRINITY_DN14380_c0_g1_i1.p1 TRINITY_DN14380_c0_g1~~TRINITY_DN14380_c0_g1_i1.p1  ORF type:complete len:685 (-),score=99.74 TRINITY_DN14380_c0_g1_i1:35-2089(-)
MALTDKVGQKAMQKAALIQDKVNADFLSVTAGIRSTLMESLKQSIKRSALSDPDMWKPVRSAVDAVVEQFWEDVEHEIERSLEAALLQARADADAEGPSAAFPLGLWYRFRAFVLHHYLPHNRSIFGKLNDPVRVFIFALILLMIAFPGPPDEYQLINYILLFKGTQFLTSGLIQMASASAHYYMCYSFHRASIAECLDRSGPGASQGFGLAFDYLGSIALVWIAFSLLAGSKRNGDSLPGASSPASKAEELKEDLARGGRLRYLLDYDRKCFAASVLLLLFLTILTCWNHLVELDFRGLLEDPQLSANIFWCCVLYSILSLPFAAFLIPGLKTVLMHCDTTGFNDHGACVTFALPTGKQSAGESNPLRGFERPVNIVTNVLHYVNIGRRVRVGSEEDRHNWEYRTGDFSRGVFNSIFGRKQEPSKTASQPSSSQPELSSKATDHNQPELNKISAADLWLQAMESFLGTAFVTMPQDGVDENDGRNSFQIHVVPQGSLDAESAVEPWHVRRYYSDFADLATALGKRCQSYAEAPFPRKHVLTKCTGDQLELRRQALEAWLIQVLKDSMSQADWALPLSRFLSDSEMAAGDAGAPSSYCSKAGNLTAEGLLENITRAGREGRTGEDADKYRFGDFSRGVWSKLTHTRIKPRPEPQSVASAAPQATAAEQNEPQEAAALPSGAAQV